MTSSNDKGAQEPGGRPSRGAIKAVRGTRDLLPDQTPLWNRVEATARTVFARYGFGEIRTPVFETTELFARGVGEEWAATSPFPFFSDYGGELAEAVRRGRAKQLAQMSDGDVGTPQHAPDPQAESTFLSAKLHWEELNDSSHAAQLDWYQRVLSVRRERILPLLDNVEACGNYAVHSGGQFTCEWTLKDGTRLCLRANLCAAPSNGFSAGLGEELWLEGSQPDPHMLGAWSVRWSIEAGK